MTADELDAFLTEMESDIRAADRDMLEIDQLNKKGVTGAGKLAGNTFNDLILHSLTRTEYENLQPRLDAVLNLHQQNRERATDLEERIARLVERHATHVSLLDFILHSTLTNVS